MSVLPEHNPDLPTGTPPRPDLALYEAKWRRRQAMTAADLEAEWQAMGADPELPAEATQLDAELDRATWEAWRDVEAGPGRDTWCSAGSAGIRCPVYCAGTL